MEQNDQNKPRTVPNDAVEFGTVRNASESFRNIPNGSEAFGRIPNHSEGFRTVPKSSERKENHTLTVREVARLFETAGVARTERSIVNWCHLNSQGVARLDAYFDPNELKYYITPQSVDLAIAEEKAKAAKGTSASEGAGTVPKDAQRPSGQTADSSEPPQVKELELQVRDLEITNRVKDQVIGMKDQQIRQLQEEQRDYIERLIDSGHRIGELETKLLQLEAPGDARADSSTKLEVKSVQ
jgi:hypothetical protein